MTPVTPMTTHADGTFTYADWDEQPFAGAEGGARLARAAVINHYSGAVEAPDTSCTYTIAYTSGTAGSFTGYEFLTGTVGGRTGSFVLEQHGTFGDDGTVSCSFSVLPGSGSGGLAGLSGSGSFTARHGVPVTPYTFSYDLG